MKTYEEMARDVLKRRDEELLKMKETQSFKEFNAPPEIVYPASPKKLGLLPKIAIPCAAAVLVGAVGVTVWSKLPSREGKYIQSGAETGNPENQHADIAPEDPYSVWVSDCHSGTPGSARETKINIVKLDDHQLGKTQLADQIHIEDNPNYKFEPLTIEELNELYQIEFNRLSRLHTDWSEEHGDLQRIVRETPSVVTESYAATGSRTIISTLNKLTYKTPNGAKIEVTADRDFSTDLSELGFSDEEFSVLGGYRAIIASYDYNGEILYGAIIDMNGTNVQISAEGLSEVEFVQVLREYTDAFDNAGENGEEDYIYIHDTMPEFFETINPFTQYNDKYASDELTFDPIDDINRYYGLEFDRLTKLHSDWKEQHSDYGIKCYDSEDEFSVSREIVSTRNGIYYTLPNTAELRVSAEIGSLNLVTPGVPLVGERVYSRVNGCDAMIYRGSEPFDDREFPNGGAVFGAVVEMGHTVIHFSAAGLTEEEFLGVLRDYTAPNPEFEESMMSIRVCVDDNYHVLEEMPKFLAQQHPFGVFCGNTFDGYTRKNLTIHEANYFYNIEFDRLGKLHTDWVEQGKDSIRFYEVDGDDELYKRGTCNSLTYTTPNGSAIYVCAQLGSLLLPETAGEWPLYSTSYVNGLSVTIYRVSGEYDEKKYPNGDARFGAMFNMNGSMVNIEAMGLTEEEFIKVLREFTAWH